MPAVSHDEIPGAIAVDDDGKPIPRPVKRGRGRPPGAKNKRTLAREAQAAEDARILAAAKAAGSATAGSTTVQPAQGAKDEEEAVELPTLLAPKPVPVQSAAPAVPSLPAPPVPVAPRPVQVPPKPPVAKPARKAAPSKIAQPEPSSATPKAPVVSPASSSFRTRRG